MEVTERTSAKPHELISIAESNGYASERVLRERDQAAKLESINAILAARERAARQIEQQRAAEERRAALISRTRMLSERTRDKVMLRGSKICKVSGDGVGDRIVGFTEDTANGKNKVSVGAGMVYWDVPENWYLCEDER